MRAERWEKGWGREGEGEGWTEACRSGKQMLADRGIKGCEGVSQVRCVEGVV